MRLIYKNDLIKIIEGANLLGTGGGGTTNSAMFILQKIAKTVKLVSQYELDQEDIVCTVFGVGGKVNCDPIIAIKDSWSLFQNINNQKFSAIVPVETGAESIASAIFVSTILNIPILDSDFVGLRSSPEVFLETISLAGLKRTPCSISDDKGNSAILYNSQNLEQMENFFRNFAISVGGDAFVSGYALSIKSLRGIIPDNSITLCQKNGIELEKLKEKKINIDDFCKKTGWTLIDTGEIIKEKKGTKKGFTQGFYNINSGKNKYKVIFKNENLIILKNNEVLLTCPDSISLLDPDTSRGINNFENNNRKKVAILARRAIPIWRTKKGKNLFSPKNLGYKYKQKLLK